MTDTDYPERTYAVRTAETFADQTEFTYLWLEKTNPEGADDWLAELQKAKSSLATLPQRCLVSEENKAYQKKKPGPPLRVFLYRRGRNTWRLLFTIHDASDDQAYVKLHQLRNAAQKPLKKWPDE